MTKVILNEQHNLFPEQETKLNEKFGNDWERYDIPMGGINKKQAAEIVKEIGNGHVFASPIPVLMVLMAEYAVESVSETGGFTKPFYAFHNDIRVKKEVPDRNNPGAVKIINTVSPEGWEIV